MAIASLIESNVSVTIRHSESEPTASVAATASANRGDATGADRRLKPVAPVDGVMAEHPSCGRESPATVNMSRDSPAILRQGRLEHGQNTADVPMWPVSRLGGDARRIVDFITIPAPIHADEAGRLLDTA